MNKKAMELGMADTRYVEPTGLSSSNQSSARDLATLVKAAYPVPLIRELSTSPEYQVSLGRRGGWCRHRSCRLRISQAGRKTGPRAGQPQQGTTQSPPHQPKGFGKRPGGAGGSKPERHSLW